MLELGEALVGELGLDQSTDTLGRWMAHFVAELIAAAREATLAQRAAAQDRCAAAILELWRHRAGLPTRRLPMELGPFIAVLKRLDPASPQPIYLRQAFLATEPEPREREATPAKEWLRAAQDVDRAARMLISFALGKAAGAEADKAETWVTLAENAGADDSADIQLVRQLIVIDTYGKSEIDTQIESIEHDLSRLSEFRRAIDMIEMELQSQRDSAIQRRSSSVEKDVKQK